MRGSSAGVVTPLSLRASPAVNHYNPHAAADDRLQTVLQDLPRSVAIQQRDIEIGVGLVGLAIILLVGSVWAAARWTAFPN